MSELVKAAEQVLKEAKAADSYRRAREDEASDHSPVSVGNYVYRSMSEVSARELGLPECGEGGGYDRCTRPENHTGRHRRASWSDRVEVDVDRFGVSISVGNEHESCDISFRTYKEFTAFWEKVNELVRFEFRSRR